MSLFIDRAALVAACLLIGLGSANAHPGNHKAATAFDAIEHFISSSDHLALIGLALVIAGGIGIARLRRR